MEQKNHGRNKSVNTFHMLLRSRTKANSVFESLTNTRFPRVHLSPNCVLEVPPTPLPRRKKSNKKLPVKINFDEASLHWNKNKEKLGNGMYKYKDTEKENIRKSIERSRKTTNRVNKTQLKTKNLDYDNTISLRNRIVYEHFK